MGKNKFTKLRKSAEIIKRIKRHHLIILNALGIGNLSAVKNELNAMMRDITELYLRELNNKRKED